MFMTQKNKYKVLTVQLSSQTVPQSPLCFISTRPLEAVPPTSLKSNATSTTKSHEHTRMKNLPKLSFPKRQENRKNPRFEVSLRL